MAGDARQGREQPEKQAGSEVGPFGGLQAAARGPAAPAALVCGGPSLLPPGLEVRAYGGWKRAVSRGGREPGRAGPSLAGMSSSAHQSQARAFKLAKASRSSRVSSPSSTPSSSAPPASNSYMSGGKEGTIAQSLAAPAPPLGGPRRPHAPAASGNSRTRLRPATPRAGPSARSARHSPPPSTGGRSLTGRRLPPWPNTGERSHSPCGTRANRPGGGGLLVGFPGCRAAGQWRKSAHHDTPKSQRPAVRLRHSRLRGGWGAASRRQECLHSRTGCRQPVLHATAQDPSSQSLRPASQSPHGAGRAERQRAP